MFVDDRMADVLKLVVLCSRCRWCWSTRARTCATRGLFRGEFFVLMLFAPLGMMVMISGELPHALPRPRADVAVPLRDGRAAARLGGRHRGGDEVLRARRARLRHAALRHVDDLRRDRHARDRRGGAAHVAAAPAHRAHRPGLRPGVRRRRHRLQARRRAVPHVGARRLPRRADRGDAVRSARAPKLAAFAMWCACWCTALRGPGAATGSRC